MRKTLRILLVFAILITPIMVDAQDERSLAPGATDSRTADIFKRHKLEKRLKEKAEEPANPEKVIPETEARKVMPEGVPAKFFLKKIEINPSEVIPENEMKGIISKYEGTEVTIKELREIIGSINKLYQTKYMITARAILPKQNIKTGVVKIVLVEGHVGNIEITGNKYTKDIFLKSRFSFKKGDLINLPQLEKDLVYINKTNDVNVKAGLVPGEAVGTTDYKIQVEEPRNYEAVVFTDNAGRKDSGLYRIGVMAVDRSLFGYRDNLTIGGTFTEGTTSLFTSYDVPITTSGTRLGVNYSYSKTKVISGPIRALNVTGSFYNIGTTLAQPLWVDKNLVVNALFGANSNKSTTEFDDFVVFNGRVHSINYGLDLMLSGNRNAIYTKHTLTNSFRISGTGRDFTKYNGDISAYILFENRSYFMFRSNVQLSSTDLLPSSEQFQVGGVATVRGYPEGMLIGNNGVTGNFEFNVPVPGFSKSGESFVGDVRAFAFSENGGVFRMSGDQDLTQNDIISSVGTGIEMTLFKNLSGRVSVGIPLIKHDEYKENSPRLHFYAQYKF